MVDSKAQAGELKKASAVGMFLVSALIILGAAIMAFRHYANDQLNEVAQDLQGITRLKKSLLNTHIDERHGDAIVFASRRSVIEMLDPEFSPAMRQIARSRIDQDIAALGKAYGYDRVLVLDRSLKVLAPDAAQSEPALAPIVLAPLSKMMESGNPVMIDLESSTGQADGTGVRYAMAHPVFDDRSRQRIIGAVYLEIDIRQRLLPLITGWTTPTRTGESFLVRVRDGKAVEIAAKPATMSPLVDKGPGAEDPKHIDSHLLAGNVGIMLDAIDSRGAAVVAAAEKIEGTAWYLVSKINVEEAQESLSDLRWILSGLTVVFLLLAGSLSWMAWHLSREKQESLLRQYVTTVETSIDGFIRVDENGRIFEANEAIARMSGYSAARLETMHLDDVEAALTPEQIRSELQRMKSGEPTRFFSRWRCADGRIIDIDVNCRYRPEDEAIYGYVRDITDSLATTRRLQQLNRYYSFLVRLNEVLSGLRNPEDILAKVCRTAFSDGQFQLVWAGVKDEGSDSIRVVCVEGAYPELADELNLNVRADDPGGKGPVGRAWREQKVVVFNDILEDAGISARHHIARKFNVRAASGIPVVIAGKTVAVLSFNSSEPDFFNDELRQLMQETAHQVALAWEAGQAVRERDSEFALRREMETRYQRIFDFSPAAIQLHAIADGHLLSINRAHESTFGYHQDELLQGDAWFDLAYPDAVIRGAVRRKWLHDIERCRSTGIISHSPELTLRAKDGSPRIVRGAMSVAGEVAIVSWIDLTQMRNQEAALRKSESRFLATFEQAAVGIALLDPSGAFSSVNGRLCEILGFERDALIGRKFQDFTHAEDLPKDLEAMQSLLNGEISVFQCDKRYLRRDGSETWVAITASLVRDTAGQPDYFVSIIENIDARKQAEQALLASEQRFRGMVENTLTAFYVAQGGHIVYVNRRLCEITGWSFEQLAGRTAFEFVLPEDHALVQAGRDRLAAGAQTTSYQIRVRRSDGNIAIMGVQASMGQWDGNPALVAIMEDVTEHQRNADRIADYVRRLEISMKGTLNAVARMVDLRDPYTAGHQRRVGLIAADIGRALGWDEARCQNMELIGLVHDIGKIAVPAEILSKPSRLTPTEFELIKGHAQASYDILKDVKFDVPVADIIVQHHERLDGTGYPKGLKGDEISIEGRVLAVADVVESMASHRPYRAALGIDAALAELDRGRDRAYDGAIVDMLKMMVKEQGYRLPT